MAAFSNWAKGILVDEVLVGWVMFKGVLVKVAFVEGTFFEVQANILSVCLGDHGGYDILVDHD